MKKNVKIKLVIFIAVLLSFLLFFNKCVLHNVFIFNNDQLLQYEIFYKEWIRLVENFFVTNEFPFYSWNQFLGSDFYSTMAIYCSGDIFLPILLLFKNNIHLGLIIESVLCAFLSAIFMQKLLVKLNVKSEEALIMAPIVYGVVSVFTIYGGTYLFQRFVTFLPLLFIGLEDLLNQKRKILYIISLTILIIQNYYFLWPTAIFVVFYCAKIEFERKASATHLVKDFLIVLGCSLVSFLLSSFLIIPSVLFFIKNERLGASISNSLFWDIRAYIGVLLNASTLNLTGATDSFFSIPGDDGHGSCYNIFIGILPIMYAFSFLIRKENKHERFFIISLLICLLVPIFNRVFHGFSCPSFRWSFLISFYFLILSAKGMNTEENLNNKKIGLVYLLLYMFLIIVSLLTGIADFDVNRTQIINLLISFVISAIVYYVYVKLGLKKSIFVFMINIFVVSIMFIDVRTRDFRIFEESFNKEYLTYYKENDDDIVFRYYFDGTKVFPTGALNLNKSLDYQIMSTQTYNSYLDYGTSTFVKKYGKTSGLDWAVYFDDQDILSVLGTKYYIVFSENELPGNDFEYKYNLDSMLVYRNLRYQGFGYTGSSLSNNFDNSTPQSLLSTIYVDDVKYDISDYDNLEKRSLKVIEKGTNYLISEIELSTKNILFIPIPYSNGWKVIVNGKMHNALSVNGGFLGIELEAGYNKIEMYYMPYGLKVGTIMTAIGVFTLGIVLIDEKLKRNLTNKTS